MSRNYTENLKLHLLNNGAKPPYEAILQRLNAFSCAQITLREPINRNNNIKNNNDLMNNNNSNKNNKHWNDGGSSAVCGDTPTQELPVSVQQQDYRNQQHLQQSQPINSTIETLVHARIYTLSTYNNTYTNMCSNHLLLFYEFLYNRISNVCSKYIPNFTYTLCAYKIQNNDIPHTVHYLSRFCSHIQILKHKPTSWHIPYQYVCKGNTHTHIHKMTQDVVIDLI